MPKPPTKHIRFRSDFDVDHGVIGSMSRNRAYTYATGGAFGGNCYSCLETDTPDMYTQFTNTAEMTFEWWQKLDGWGCSGTTWTGSPPTVFADGHPHVMEVYAGPGWTSGWGCMFMFLARQDNPYFGGGAVLNYGLYGGAAQAQGIPINLNANQWHHIALVGKDNDYMKLYIDGSLIHTMSTSGRSINGTNGTYCFGSRSSGTTCRIKGYIDNLKIYDYAKTDFSDRFNERGGMNDSIVALIYNTYSGGGCTTCNGTCDPVCEVCDGTCNPACQTCDGACDPVCEGVCDGYCNPMCQGVCDGYCNPACQACDPVCQGVCDSSCNPVCQGVCDGTCNPSCEYCDPLCTASCDGYCNMDGGGECG